MGLDGGTIATRSDILRRQKWKFSGGSHRDTSRSTRGGSVSTSQVLTEEERPDERFRKVAAWTTCALTGEQLAEPVVADYLGSLFNKADLLEYILACRGVGLEGLEAQRKFRMRREHAGQRLEHLTCMADFFPVFLPALLTEAEGIRRCDITDVSCIRYPFAALAPCGHVFSSKALDKVTDRFCPGCQREFSEIDVIAINGTDKQVEALRELLPARSTQRRKKRKSGASDNEGDPKKGKILSHQ